MKYTKSGSREFFKVIEETGVVVRVVNKHKDSTITISRNMYIISNANDPYDSTVITEAEFNEQLEIARRRLDTLELT